METIKEEKKADLEQLLNSLIEKGWKPFGNKKIKDAKTARWNINLLNEEVNKVSKFKDKVAFTNGVLIFDEINLRELVSKESGLWQFVCENGMININYGNIREYYSEKENGGIYLRRLNGEDNYEYRLIETSLKNEDELEQFLLDNIIINEQA